MAQHTKLRSFEFRFQLARDALAAGFTTKAAQKEAIDNLTTALECVFADVKEDLIASRGVDGRLSDEDRDLYYDHPSYPHEWTPKLAARFARWPEAVAKANQIRALRDAIKAAPVVKPEPKPTPAQAAKLAKTMTCQCCARPIFAETGVIAHHGYQRPGTGYQTASCEGARELPFEVSRDALGRHIDNLKAYLGRTRAYLVKVQAETAPITFSFTDYTTTDRYGAGTPTSRRVTRETFPTIWEETKAARRYNQFDKPDFDALKVRVVRAIKADINVVTAAIEQQEERFAGWKQTHCREGEKWVEV